MEENKKDHISNLLKHISEKKTDNFKMKRDMKIEWLVAHIEEYLSPFIVIGYDVNGTAVVVQNCKTQQDYDSIQTSIERHIASQIIEEYDEEYDEDGDDLE